MNIDTLEQEPCNTCGYEEGNIYCKEHCPHEAKIKQELTEFEEIDFMQEHKKIPVTLDLTSCEDAISRKIISAFLSGLISDDVERKKALEYINELPPVNPTKTGWIPVSERLPENRKEVLVTDDTDIFTGWYEGDKWCSCYEEFCPYSDPIIAWMPLPKPYEPQERSDKE